MMSFNIRSNDPSKPLSDEDISFIMQQMEIAASVTSGGPPEGFEDWSEKSKGNILKTKCKAT